MTKDMKKRNRNLVISLIGRPNVGKSSVFNALMGKQHKSITFDEPGVTRDRHYGIATITERADLAAEDVILVDTGGFYPVKTKEDITNRDKFFNIMTTHAHTAIDESDLVLMVVDVREGVLPFDIEIANYIRSAQKEYWLIINKYDTDKQAGSEADFYQIPVDEYFLTSAAHNRGLTDLKERIHEFSYNFSKKENKSSSLSAGVTPREEVVSRFALIGAPNAGKSTLLNQFVGAERALVSDIPGTTVDPIEGYFDLFFGEDASKLVGDRELTKNDKSLFQQYEDFRFNNPKVYSQIVEIFERESILNDQKGQFLAEDFDSKQVDELDEAPIGHVDADGMWSFDSEAESLQLEANTELDEKGESVLEELSNKLFSSDINEEEVLNDSEDDSENIESVSSEKLNEGLSLWRSIHLVDTAGIRRKSNIKDFVEGQSVYRSLRCIAESDVVLFMIDATKGIGHQDRRLIDIALEKGKSLIVCMNKMDLLEKQFKDPKDKKEWLEDLRYKIPWLNFCDIVTISAKKKSGLNKLKKLMVKTILVRKKVIPTGELNRFIFNMVESNPVVVGRSGGKRLKVKYASQVQSAPPTFLFFTNRSRGIADHYKRYLRNGLRREFKLDNTPVHLIFRSGSDLDKRMSKVKK